MLVYSFRTPLKPPYNSFRRKIKTDNPIITIRKPKLTAMYGGNALIFILPTPRLCETPKKLKYLSQSQCAIRLRTSMSIGKSTTTIVAIVIEPVAINKKTPRLKTTLRKKVAATMLSPIVCKIVDQSPPNALPLINPPISTMPKLTVNKISRSNNITKYFANMNCSREIPEINVFL